MINLSQSGLIAVVKNQHLVALIILIGALVAGGWWFLTYQNNTPKNNPVTNTSIVLMKEDSFEPETITIKKGVVVTFKNEDKVARWPASNIHPTHTIYPEFDPQKPIEPGQSWSFTFDKVGSWKDHDHLIPSIRGIIVVTE